MLNLLTLPQFSKATKILADYWCRLPKPGDHTCPYRSDFSVKGIAQFLPEIFMSEWVGDDDLRILQAGTKLDQILGKDLTQQNIFDVLPPELISEEREYYRNLREMPCAGVITRQARNLKNQPVVYRTVQLPLLDRHGVVRYFVGTGSVLNTEEIAEEFGDVGFDQIAMLERQYWDIGAGVPGELVDPRFRVELIA